MLDKRDMFFINIHNFRNIFIGQMAIKQKLDNLQVAKIQRFFQTFHNFWKAPQSERFFAGCIVHPL